LDNFYGYTGVGKVHVVQSAVSSFWLQLHQNMLTRVYCWGSWCTLSRGIVL